jgi:alpha-mannosidase
MKPQFIYMYQSHLDLFWLGNYHTCLERGSNVMKQYIDRCREHQDETYLIETVVFLRHFLRSYPEYKEIVKEMWSKGQIDIGCAYVDVWQNLVLGESHIRNITEGRNWLKRELGLDVTQAVHPDLPGLTPQTAQIYAKAGVRTYVTVRKIFGDGQVWVYEAPDGSRLMVLNQPIHYDFRPFDDDDTISFNREWGVINAKRTLEGFPIKKVLLSAGSSDLTSMETFEERIGRPAREVIDDYGRRYPEYEFKFGSFRLVLDEYKGIEDQLPHVKGEIPSVWGVACDESVRFFQAARLLEGKLLTAGMLEALGEIRGIEPIASSREEWFGTFYEGAHFRENDPISRGNELPSLWDMHIFTQDHNGGGQEGALSEFQKRTIQERAIAYADRIISHYMNALAGRLAEPGGLLLFNPLNRGRYEPIELDIPKEWIGPALGFRSAGKGVQVPWQAIEPTDASDVRARIVLAAPIDGAGYTTLSKDDGAAWQENTTAASIIENEDLITIASEKILLSVNKRTGAIESLMDRATGTNWGSDAVNQLYAVRETGNDVTLRADESASAAYTEVVHRVEVSEAGPLFVRISIVKEILKARVEQDITLWLQGIDRVDVDTVIYWHGQHNIQLRQCMPTAADRHDAAYGSPFYSSGWMDTAEGCCPKSPDELLSEDYHHYREIQMWLHLKREKSALAIATGHPGFHWGANGLEAVLLRTSPSCGDDRFYWENSGKQQYHFRFKFGSAEDKGWASDFGQQLLCPVVTAELPLAGCPGDLPNADRFVRLEEDNLILSSVYPDQDHVILRFYETMGRAVQAHLNVQGMEQMVRMTLDGKVLQTVVKSGAGWSIPVEPYEIVTLRARISTTSLIGSIP